MQRLSSLYTRLSRIGLDQVDRATARFLMGANHFFAAALICATPFAVGFFVVDGGLLWHAGVVHLGLMLAWFGAYGLNHSGKPQMAAVFGLVAPLIAYLAQTSLLSVDAGFLLPMLTTPAVSFVIIAPRYALWRWVMAVLPAAVVAWTYLDPQFSTATLDASPVVIDTLLVANVALTMVILGVTAWLNDFFFTRERKRAERRLSEAVLEARTDDLTRLANRRGMTELLDSVPRGGHYVLAIADIDNFKLVNDKLGHTRGDVVISEVAKVLAEGLGPSATVARWGGEEFLILFTETRLTAAVAAMERARKAVEVFVGVDGDGSAVTLSAGLAAASGDFPWDITVRVADALLYDAKEAGRNRIRYAQVRGGVEEWEPEP